MQDNSLRKTEKLKGKKAVSELFGPAKKSIKAFPLKAFYVILNNDSNNHIKFGVTVPKKKFKRAVDRNRIKRLLRESIRLNKHVVIETIKSHHVSVNVMLIFHGNEILPFKEIEKSVIDLFNSLNKTIENEKK